MAVKDAPERNPARSQTYRKKRDFKQTPEPSGRKEKPRQALRFVVQMHRATRLHYDFRLEADGVLASWAVPKGPTLVPVDRRLAMHVEDHPLDYRDFEGTIPAGQYGAGNVIVWDNGTYALAEGDDPADEIANGKIKFILHGKKLRGEFTLVKIKPREGEKRRPVAADQGSRRARRPQVRSGTTIPSRSRAARRSPTSPHDPRSQDVAVANRSQTATAPTPALAREARSAAEVKAVDAGNARRRAVRRSPSGSSRSNGTAIARSARSRRRQALGGLAQRARYARRFPELAQLSSAFESVPIVVDGEIVSLDSKGARRFSDCRSRRRSRRGLTFARVRSALRRRARSAQDAARRAQSAARAVDSRRRASCCTPSTSSAAEKRSSSMRAAAEARRDHRQAARLDVSGAAQPRLGQDQDRLRARVRRRRLDGAEAAAARDSARCCSARTTGKAALRRSRSAPASRRKLLAELTQRLREASSEKRRRSSTTSTRTRQPHWVAPKLVVEVRFTEWTRDGYLRQPAYLGLRLDKAASEVVAGDCRHERIVSASQRHDVAVGGRRRSRFRISTKCSGRATGTRRAI